MRTLELFTTVENEEKQEQFEFARVPEFLKTHTGSVFRSAFFSEEGKPNCFGPLTITFAVRTARDILLEGCDYQELELKIESAGRILPAIPGKEELIKLLDSPETLVHANGKLYKAHNEIFDFQRVYDDAAKCREKLKRLGFSDNSMAIYATPEDITIEVNSSILGLEGNEELPSRYYKLLCYLGEIKEVGGKPQKTSVKTILIDTACPGKQILVPGSLHPRLKRTKVNIGASHFSYGIAAFSDDCSKKRTTLECIQESLNWVKFCQKEFEPIASIRELLDTIPLIALPDKNRTGTAATSSVNSASVLATLAPVAPKSFFGVFQPLKTEIEAAGQSFKELSRGISTSSAGLDKVLGGGWSVGGVHIVLGNRENGKFSLLLQQALLCESRMPVLFISFEQNLKNFVTNAACFFAGLSRSETLSALASQGPTAAQAKLTFGAAIDKLSTKLSQNLFFSGIEAGRLCFDTEEILQLASMLPDAPNKLIVIDSVSESDFGGNINAQLQKLKAVAIAGGITVLMSIHTDTEAPKRPNLIEEADIDYLSKYHRFSDTIVDINSEKTNLRKFVSLVKGQVDPTLVANLEQKAAQLCGGKKQKSDTYSLMRFISNRNGRREMLLCYYQPDLGRFYDLASVPLGKL